MTRIVFIVALVVFLNFAFVARSEKVVKVHNEFDKTIVVKHGEFKYKGLVRIILGILTFIIVFLVVFIRVRIWHEIKKRKLNITLKEKKE